MRSSFRMMAISGVVGLACSMSVRAEEAVPAAAPEQPAAAEKPAAVEQQPAVAPANAVLVFDGFEFDQNLLKGRSGNYEQAPSRIFATRSADTAHSGKRSLKVKYDKKGTGGPFGTGGWCGYWSQFKIGNQYYDATEYKKLTLWVKGEKGGENFKIGMADMHWDKQQDSVKSQDITAYLPEGKITTEWQKATIPMEDWFIDFKQLASMAVCFESDSYENGAQAGLVYVDDIQLEK
jgi:hypothetical protein